MATITTTIKYVDNLVDWSNRLKAGHNEIVTTELAANKLATALGGERLMRAAHNAVAAIEQVGGVAKLTTQEQERLLASLDKSIAKMERMGQVVPAAMRATANELRTATAAAEKKVSALERVDGALGKVGLSIGSLGVAGLVTGLVSVGRQAVAAAGQIVDLADKTKLSTTAVQQYGYMARQTGGDVTQWADAVFKGGIKIEQGSKATRDAADRFVGGFEQLRALKPEAQFDAIMRALASIEGPQERNRVGVDLLGKGYANVAAAVDDYVKMLGEAPVAGEAAVRATDAAADAVSRVWEKTKSLAIDAIGGVVMAVENAQKKLADLATTASVAPAGIAANTPRFGQRGSVSVNPFAVSGLQSARLVNPRPVVTPNEAVVPPTAAEDLRTFAQRAADAQREIAGLSVATRSQIDAGLKLGESIEDLGAQFNLSADAQRFYTTTAKASTQAQSEAAKAAERHAEATANVNARIADLTPLQLMQVQALLAAGNAERDIAEALRVTERHVQIVAQAEKNRADQSKDQLAQIKLAEEQRQAFLGTAQKLEDQIMKGEIDRLNARNQQTVKNLLATRDLEQQVRDLNATRSLSAHNQQVYQIRQWAETQKTAFRGTEVETVRFYNAIEAVTAARIRALTKTWREFFSGDFVNTIMAAVTGGGNVGQAVGASLGNMIGDSLSRSLGDTIGKKGNVIAGPLSKMFGSAVGGVLNAALPGLGAMAGSLITKGLSALGGALGFGSAGRDLVKGFADKMGGFDQLRSTLTTLGDEGERLWKNLTQGVGRNSPDQATRAINAIEQALTRYEEQQRVVLALQEELQSKIVDLMGAVDQFGGRAPVALRPYIQDLLQMNGLTAEQQLLLSDLLAEPGWQEMEQAAERLGVKIGSLGATFAQAKLSDQALQTVRDLQLLEQGGADMNAVLRDSAAHVQSLVTTAMNTGSQLPETLKPYIQRLIDLELLVDPAGELVRNIDQLSFADIKDDALEAIKGILEQIRDLLQTQIPDAALAAQEAIEAIPPPRRLPPSGRHGLAPSPADEVPTAHSGAMVTAAGIRRFHTGFPRLASDEFPAILQTGEAVLNRSATATLGYSRIAGLNRGQMQGDGGDVSSVVINVYPTPGMSESQVAEMVYRRLPRRVKAGGL